MAKKSTKKFLNRLQVETLKKKDWIVKPNGFYATFEQHEFKYNVWEELCELAGADPDSETITLLIFGFKQK